MTRFVLLIVATVSASLTVLSILAGIIGRTDVPGLPGVHACAADARADAGRVPALTLLTEYGDCVAHGLRASGLTIVATALAPLGIALAVYTLYPWLLRRRMRLLSEQEEPGLHTRADEVLRSALGPYRDRVTLLITRGSAGGARAFGAWGRYWIAIDRGLLPAEAEGAGTGSAVAVIHHEAAHVRNRDIDITYLTIAIWWGFLAISLLLLPLAFLNRQVVVDFGLPLAVALAVLVHARARVLRVRELYADARSALDPQARPWLLHLLGRPARTVSGPKRVLRALTSAHPPPDVRRATIQDPRRLLRGGDADVAFTGFAIGLSYSVLQLFLPTPDDAGGRFSLPTALIFATFLTTVLTAIIWRSVLGESARGRRSPSTARTALALTCGVLVGQVLTPGPHVVTWDAMLVASPPGALLLAVLLWGWCWILVGSLSFAATCWTSGSRRSWPLWACAAVNVPLAVVALDTWFATLAFATMSPGLWSVVYWTTALLTTSPYLLSVGLLAGLSFPLLAWIAWDPGQPGADGASGPDPARRLCPPRVPVTTAMATFLCLVAVTPLIVFLGPTEETVLLGLVVVVGPVLTVLATGVMAWRLGGRGAIARVLCTTVVTVALLAPLYLPAAYLGTQLIPCLGVPVGEGGCWSAPELRGRVWLLNVFLLVPTLLVACPTAVVICAVRAQRGREARRVPPAAGYWPKARASGLVLVLAAGISAIIVGELSNAARTSEPHYLGDAARAEILAPASAKQQDGATTCAANDRFHAESLGIALSAESDLSRARAVRVMAASTDPVLREFAQASVEAVGEDAADGGADPGRVAFQTSAAALNYCGSTYPGTGSTGLGW
ncbi:peptidase M48-like protein [Nocardiopsis sp. Huas11]|uniref:M48 family metalloprotease n=1 Tax=Nocardiopsis sp. Huas11 TaxID=2183912 RepID=UPI000EB34587|nr:M48 family metalloprotease [Nocardiopsis sp. Huas11]RKS10359.1 peptidase M48-like protein [Nocardiopsis sp. Huas11]